MASRRFDAPAVSSNVAAELTVPAGRYRFTDYAASWTISPSRRGSGVLSYSAGGYYGGTRREFAASSVISRPTVTFRRSKHQVVEESLPTAGAVTQLFGARLTTGEHPVFH